MRNLLLCLILLLLGEELFAQERTLQGVVFDRDSKIRLTRVNILNLRDQTSIYNNSKGEFKIRAQSGDLLIAQLEGYISDTLKVGNENDVIFYLRRKSIQLKEVIIRDTVQSPSKRLKEMREDFKDIYRIGNSSDLLSFGGPNGGAGLSIDALYSLLSKEGKDARKLQKIIVRDYKELVIDYRYTPVLVQQTTGLSGAKLIDFMQQYRPTYNFILEANDYDLVCFIQAAHQKYLKNPSAYRLPALK